MLPRKSYLVSPYLASTYARAIGPLSWPASPLMEKARAPISYAPRQVKALEVQAAAAPAAVAAAPVVTLSQAPLAQAA